jgi:rhomboid protease GluP
MSGDFFSSWFQASNVISVGASTSIFGIFGVMLGFMFLNWQRLEKSPYSRTSVLVAVGLIVLFNVGVTGSDFAKNVDNLAHMGGFISGIFVGMMFADLPNSETLKYEWKIKILGLVLYSGFTLLCLIMIFLVNNKPSQRILAGIFEF